MNEYRPPSTTMFPPVVKNLLIANVVFYIATLVFRISYNYDITDILGLHYFQCSNFKIYQLVTYLFLHDTSSFFIPHNAGAGSLAHIVFNMFGLWMFGNVLENYWGAKKFIIFYFVCGIGAGITQEFFQYFNFHHIQQVIETFSASPNETDFSAIAKKYFGMDVSGGSPAEYVPFLQKTYRQSMDDFITIGASGAIFGILLAFGMLFPNTELFLLFLPIPIKAKWAVLGYGLWELFSGVANRPGDNIGHFAHLGGMLFGFILIMYWKKKRT